jgi:tRNA pseudouridine13 synthase
VAPRDISAAGLKDRHARTVQTIAIRGGPERSLEQARLRLTPCGRAPRALERGDVLGNHFQVRLRDLSPQEAERVGARLGEVLRDGFANYFDDQRFGSARGSRGRLAAESLVRGDPEDALRLAVATPSSSDRGPLKTRRQAMRDRWGRWPDLVARLPPSSERRIASALAAGGSFTDAYGLLSRAQRSLHLSALQAALFNDGLRHAVPRGPSHPGTAGPYVFFEDGGGRFAEERVPLAEGRAAPHALLDGALGARGLDRAMLTGHALRRGMRALVVHPQELIAEAPASDALQKGRQSVGLSFGLGAGSYATMLIKRVTYDVQVRRDPRRKGRRRA